MPYVHTHESGLKMLKLFCKDTGLEYCGGFVLGFGAMLNGRPLDHLPNAKKEKKAFEHFIKNVQNGEHSPESLYQDAQIKIPKWIVKLLLIFMNRKISENLKKEGINENQRNPYLD